MTAIRALELTLSSFGDGALRGGFSEAVEMKRYARALEHRFGSPNADKPRTDRREPALRRLLAEGRIESTRDVKYVCYGLADPIGPQKQRVLGNQIAFSALLQHLHTLERDPRRLRRCYLGLLSAYFEFDGRNCADATTREHWNRLRLYLGHHLDTVASATPVPKWASTLKEHSNLLEVKPCEPYAKLLLGGLSEEFEAMRRALDISGNSWVIHEAAFAAIDNACKETEDTFLDYLPALMELMQVHPVIQNPALAKVLGKYAQIRNRQEHRALCHFAVSLWGNPLLKKNLKNWDIAGQAATDMVSLWLKSTLIEDFFELLSADGTTDKRRVKFWQRYVEAIDDMYFALGRSALFDKGEDIHRLRKTMGDNLLRLEGGASTNNGFFIVMGNHVIVEFGQKGNAAFIFKNTSLPFELGGAVSGLGKSQWKDDAEAYLRHFDRSHSRWEKDFEEELRRIVGVTPGVALVRGRAIEAPSNRPTHQPSSVPFDVNNVRSLCARYGLAFTDERAKRRFVIHASDANKLVSQALAALGFVYDATELHWHRKF